jgi:hypothetical protein
MKNHILYDCPIVLRRWKNANVVIDPKELH